MDDACLSWLKTVGIDSGSVPSKPILFKSDSFSNVGFASEDILLLVLYKLNSLLKIYFLLGFMAVNHYFIRR